MESMNDLGIRRAHMCSVRQMEVINLRLTFLQTVSPAKRSRAFLPKLSQPVSGLAASACPSCFSLSAGWSVCSVWSVWSVRRLSAAQRLKNMHRGQGLGVTVFGTVVDKAVLQRLGIQLFTGAWPQHNII